MSCSAREGLNPFFSIISAIATWSLKMWKKCGQRFQKQEKERKSQSQWTKTDLSPRCFFEGIRSFLFSEILSLQLNSWYFFIDPGPNGSFIFKETGNTIVIFSQGRQLCRCQVSSKKGSAKKKGQYLESGEQVLLDHFSEGIKQFCQELPFLNAYPFCLKIKLCQCDKGSSK